MIEITIDQRLCGPPNSGNGGHVCGMLASAQATWILVSQASSWARAVEANADADAISRPVGPIGHEQFAPGYRHFGRHSLCPGGAGGHGLYIGFF